MSDKWDLPHGQTQYDPKDLSHHIVHKEPYHAHVTETHHKTEPLEAKPEPQKPSVGRIVHFVLDSGQSKGQHRPAIVVNDWNGSTRINLQVFTDGENDGQLYKSGIYWATSVPYADPSENKPFSWHWPERV